jgi:hypothetical protein
MANPNPSPETRFQPGNKANPGGKTSEHRRLEIEAAEMAARLRHAMLSAMTEKLATCESADDLLSPDALRLIKDSEDRAHGTPKQAVVHEGDENNPIRHVIERRIVGSAPNRDTDSGGV